MFDPNFKKKKTYLGGGWKQREAVPNSSSQQCAFDKSKEIRELFNEDKWHDHEYPWVGKTLWTLYVKKPLALAFALSLHLFAFSLSCKQFVLERGLDKMTGASPFHG